MALLLDLIRAGRRDLSAGDGFVRMQPARRISTADLTTTIGSDPERRSTIPGVLDDSPMLVLTAAGTFRSRYRFRALERP